MPASYLVKIDWFRWRCRLCGDLVSRWHKHPDGWDQPS